MKNGIGGRTVAEARERLTWNEFNGWLEYRRRFGSLDTAQRLERLLAHIAVMISKALGGDAKVEDFIPHAEPRIADLDDLKRMFGGGNGNA